MTAPTLMITSILVLAGCLLGLIRLARGPIVAPKEEADD
jgi:hypothetical protein